MDLVKLIRVYVDPTLHPNSTYPSHSLDYIKIGYHLYKLKKNIGSPTPQVLKKNEKENWYWERQPPTPSKMTKNICKP